MDSGQHSSVDAWKKMSRLVKLKVLFRMAGEKQLSVR